MTDEHSFRLYKRRSIECAKDLGYSIQVLAAIKNATTENEIDRILRTARLRGCK